MHSTKRKCKLLKLNKDMKWVFSATGSCASLLTRVVKRNLIWQSVFRLINDEKKDCYFYTSLRYQCWRSPFLFTLWLYLSVLFLKCLQNNASCGGETVFSQNWILKQTCRSWRKSLAETETTRYKTFSSQRAVAVRGPDGGFQHHEQWQLHLHLPATRGDDDANILCGSV